MPGLVDTSTCMSITALEFTAAWCGPCKQMEPVLAALGKEYEGRVRIVTVDVDHEQVLAQQYNVRSMPTLVLLRDGRAFVAGMFDRALSGDVAIAAP
jgi:thioredoxin-like negative regulator of GroEL